MPRSLDPDHDFSQFIGAWFHQDAFDDHASVDDIVDEFVRRASPRLVASAAEGGRRLLGEGLDEAALADRLHTMGLWLVPEPAGFASHVRLLEHLVQRLEQAGGGVEDAAG